MVTGQQGSASLMQRKQKIGYKRGGRWMDQVEGEGMVGRFEGRKDGGGLKPDLGEMEDD